MISAFELSKFSIYRKNRTLQGKYFVCDVSGHRQLYAQVETPFFPWTPKPFMAVYADEMKKERVLSIEMKGTYTICDEHARPIGMMERTRKKVLFGHGEHEWILYGGSGEELGRFETKQLTSERETLLFTLSSRCQGIGFIKWYGGIDFRGLAGRQAFIDFTIDSHKIVDRRIVVCAGLILLEDVRWRHRY